MPPSPPSSAGVRNWTIGVIVLVVALAATTWWYMGRSGTTEPTDTALREDSRAAAAGGPPGRPFERGPEGAVGPPVAEVEVGERELQWEAILGSPPRWPDDLNDPADCEEVERSMQQVCRALEARPYLHRYEDLCGLLRQVAEEVTSRPPSLTSELASYDDLVGNVFHLFRVLGRERMGVLRQLLREEEQLAEPLAMAMHRWLISRESCTKGDTPVSLEALYDYSSFLFNTMGGQAYLRRRSPEVEALACFYALQVIDEAVGRGHNPWGVDPRPEISRCRGLVASQPLVFGDRYSDLLTGMERDWARKGELP